MSSVLATQTLAKRWSMPTDDFNDLFSAEHTDKTYQSNDSVLSRGQRLNEFGIVVAGWLIRYRITLEGRRQILHVLLPGDFVALNALTGGEVDHDVEALTAATVRTFDSETVISKMATSPTLLAGLWRGIIREESSMRDQIVRIGRRSALMRLPHFFIELHERLRAIGHADGEMMSVPLTQNDLGDILGLSNVHINRTLQTLKREGLLEVDGQAIRIPNIHDLAAFCDFDFRHPRSDIHRRPVNFRNQKSRAFATASCTHAM